MLAERRRVFVNGEAGSIGGNLEEHSTGLEEVDRLEPEAVDHLCRTPACALDFLAHLELGLVVGDAPRDVVNTAGSPPAAIFIGNLANLEVAPRSAAANLESQPLAFGADVDEPENT